MKKINILHLINCLDCGGAETLLVDGCNASDFKRFNIHIIYFKGNGELVKEIDEKVSISKFSYHGFFNLKFFIKINNYVRINKINIIHTHMVQSSLLGRFIARINSRVCITTRHYVEHTSYKSRIYKIEDNTIKYSNKIICVSNAVKNYLESINIPPSKLIVIHNGIKVKEIEKNYNTNGLRLGTVCRLVHEKRIDIMIEAIKKLKEKYIGIKLEIIGDGKMRDEISNMINNYNLQNDVILLGEMPRSDSNNITNNWDIYLNSSENESFGISVLEAMSNKIPVIASNVGGLPEIINHNYNGILFNLFEDDLSEKIIYLIENQKIRKLYANNAIDKIKSDFSINATIAKIEKLYLKFIN